MNRIIFLIVLFLVFGGIGLIPTSKVVALSCLPTGSIEEEQKEADLVFRGNVINSIENSDNSITYEFKVAEVWKGDVGSNVELTQSETEIQWFYTFEENSEYVVFAVEEGAVLKLPLCGVYYNLTLNSADYENIADMLGEGIVPTDSNNSNSIGSDSAFVIVLGAILVVAGVAVYLVWNSANTKIKKKTR